MVAIAETISVHWGQWSALCCCSRARLCSPFIPASVPGGFPDVPAVWGCSRCPLKHSKRLPWSPLGFGPTQLGQILLLGLPFLCHCEVEPCTNSSVPVELSFTHEHGWCSAPPAPSPLHLAELTCRNPPAKICATSMVFLNICKVLTGWKATYPVSIIAGVTPLCLVMHPSMPAVPVGQHRLFKPPFEYMWIHPPFFYQERRDKALKKTSFPSSWLFFFFFFLPLNTPLGIWDALNLTIIF